MNSEMSNDLYSYIYILVSCNCSVQSRMFLNVLILFWLGFWWLVVEGMYLPGFIVLNSKRRRFYVAST